MGDVVDGEQKTSGAGLIPPASAATFGLTGAGGVAYAASGRSAAELTHTLKTVGGGSMGRGIAVVSACVLAVAAVGYGVGKYIEDHYKRNSKSE